MARDEDFTAELETLRFLAKVFHNGITDDDKERFNQLVSDGYVTSNDMDMVNRIKGDVAWFVYPAHTKTSSAFARFASKEEAEQIKELMDRWLPRLDFYLNREGRGEDKIRKEKIWCR